MAYTWNEAYKYINELLDAKYKTIHDDIQDAHTTIEYFDELATGSTSSVTSGTFTISTDYASNNLTAIKEYWPDWVEPSPHTSSPTYTTSTTWFPKVKPYNPPLEDEDINMSSNEYISLQPTHSFYGCVMKACNDCLQTGNHVLAIRIIGMFSQFMTGGLYNRSDIQIALDKANDILVKETDSTIIIAVPGYKSPATKKITLKKAKLTGINSA